MQRTFFYTQIKSNDFNILKETCQPFSKDIFSADQEHIVAFEQTSTACKAALKFLNHINDQGSANDYKIVLVQGAFTEDRPEELPVRVARSIHQHARAKNLYITEEILNQVHASDIVVEPKAPLFVKALQKEIPTFSLTRFEETELKVDPTDLFDFSQVDSYSSLNQIANTGKPAAKPKDPFESSNTTIELDPVRKKMLDTGKVKPVVTGPQAHNSGVTHSRVVTKPQAPVQKAQSKSVAIIVVLLVIVTGAGLYLAKSKPVPAEIATTDKSLPLPQIPSATPPAGKVINPSSAPVQQPAPPPVDLKTPVPTVPVYHSAFVHIHSAPKGADIWMNGKKIAKKTPLNNVKVGTKGPLLIEVQKAGYQKASKMMDLEPKETRTVMFQLVANKAKTPAKKSKKK